MEVVALRRRVLLAERVVTEQFPYREIHPSVIDDRLSDNVILDSFMHFDKILTHLTENGINFVIVNFFFFFCRLRWICLRTK